MLTAVEFVIIALVAIVLGAAGWLLGSQFGRELLGAVAGSIIAFPIGLFLSRRQRRWIAIALLAVWFVLSYLAGGWQGAFYAIAASGLTFFVSAAILTDLYGGGIFRALFYHLRLALGLLRGIQIIGDGKTMIPRDATEVMGPRVVIVGPNNAVILERGARQSRISGPGIFTSEQFEYAKRIYNLRPQQRELTFSDVLTEDLIVTTIEICVIYGVAVPDACKRGEADWTDRESQVIQQADSLTTDWEEGTLAAIEGSLRAAAGSRNLQNLVAGGGFGNLERDIQRLTVRRMRNWGIQLYEVVVRSVQPTQEVTEATADQWVSNTQRETTRLIEIGRADAMRQSLELIAQGYQVAKGMGMSQQEIEREVLRRTLEEIAKDPATKLIFPPELHALLVSLSN